MASDFGSCGFGAITPELILRSLVATKGGLNSLRIESYTNVTQTSPIHCATKEDFQINLSRALTMAQDGAVALRVNFVVGLGDGGFNDCANAVDDNYIKNSFFGEGVDGKVYFNVDGTNPS